MYNAEKYQKLDVVAYTKDMRIVVIESSEWVEYETKKHLGTKLTEWWLKKKLNHQKMKEVTDLKNSQLR